MFRRMKNLRGVPASVLYKQPWLASTARAPHLDPLQLVEEERTPQYSPELFYPARIGELLGGRYQIATKLGYGSGSTVWLARDLYRYRWQDDKYVAIKITANSRHAQSVDVAPELPMLERIARSNPQHKGWHFVRQLVDRFSIENAEHQHLCLVFDPLREPLWIYAHRFVDKIIPSDVLKVQIQMILHGLAYLHDECNIIHTDIKPDNIMVRVEDPAIFEKSAKDEHEDPLPQKQTGDRIIYMSRNNYGRLKSATGVLQIVDFDRAVLGTKSHSGCIQADLYRAPEVILDSGYSYSVDIWGLGVMLWELFEGDELFKVAKRDGVKEYDEVLHLTQMTALLGPIPTDLIAGERASMFYDSEGQLLHPFMLPAEFSFESEITKIQGEDKAMMINFLKRMIKWRPEDRSTAKELLTDPWLYNDFPVA